MSYGSNCQARCNHPGSWFWRREVFTVPFLSIFFICSVFILLSLYKFYLCMYRARARVCMCTYTDNIHIHIHIHIHMQAYWVACGCVLFLCNSFIIQVPYYLGMFTIMIYVFAYLILPFLLLLLAFFNSLPSEAFELAQQKASGNNCVEDSLKCEQQLLTYLIPPLTLSPAACVSPVFF